ncbi:hypothetical protein V2J09_000777 [Rumex salicifolius]
MVGFLKFNGYPLSASPIFRHNLDSSFSFSSASKSVMGAKSNCCTNPPQQPPLRRRTWRRKWLRYWPLIPLMYVWGLILCSCPVSLIMYHTPVPGSVYRSHQLFRALRPRILADNSTSIQLSKVWKYKKLAKPRYCPSSPTGEPKDGQGQGGYLIVEANGGLNQQRSSICNAVAIAGLLNATLVIPRFEYHKVWRDPSEFGDIYDEDHFISTLAGFVNVVKELPRSLLDSRFEFNMSGVLTVHVQAWAPIDYYLESVQPLLQNQGVIRIAPFANRLAMNVPPRIQVLRCLANYKALRFAPTISTLGKQLVKRMMRKSAASDGKYVAIHLRFEEDMVAFSCCLYDGGLEERALMNRVREKGWGGKFRHRSHMIDPGLNRITGKCPLTPLEVGMMLRAMGFDNKTAIYLASGKLYQSEVHLAPLLDMFPLVYTKELLATQQELAPFEGYSSRLAALDYTVCLFSEVFVTTHGGNFPHFLTGHRKLMYGGHAKTIKPNKMRLVRLFHNTLTSWEEMKLEMRRMLAESNREGMRAPHIGKSRRKASVYEYPFPDCGCELQGARNMTVSLANVDGILDDDQLHFIV